MMKRRTPGLIALFFALLALAGFFSSNASAEILEDIGIREEKDEVVITIQLATQVQYKRHAPVKQGQTLDIYYQVVDPAQKSLIADNETRLSPPSELIQDFTVASRLENNETELVIQFDREVKYRVTPGKDNRSFLIHVSKSSIGVVTRVLPIKKEGKLDLPEIKPEASDDQNTKQAAGFMTEGRDALQAGNFAAAIEAFNKLLQLPSSKYTQDAQEWVGVAREGAGQPDRAKLEYESYLKLYTAGAGVARVQERLAKLQAAPVVARAPAEEKKPATQTSTFGSLSMHYYRGASVSETTTANVVTNNQTPPSRTDSKRDLTTDIDITSRFRSDEYDNRLMFRDSYINNFLYKKELGVMVKQPSRNKLNTALFEVKNKVMDYSARLGRQSAMGGGVLGRFDGAFADYGLSPAWRAKGVAGRLVDTSSQPVTQPVFYGAQLDMIGSSGGGWNGSVYVINQTLEGFADRRAVGTELRYSETTKNAFVILDYDTSYAVLNMALVQGTLNSESGTTFNFMLDRRKSPSMSIRNAVVNTSGATPTLNGLLQIMSMDEMKKLAKDRTATSTLTQIGVTHPLDEQWQAGGDIKLSNTSSMPASGTPDNPDGTLGGIEGFNSDPGTGNQWTFTGQLIGNNIFSERDVNVFSLSHSPQIHAQSFFVTNRTTVSKWTYDASLLLFKQDLLGKATTRVSPTFKVVYQAKEKLNLELEGGLEIENATEKGTSTKDTRNFFTLGFRWDFG